jgi:hypothetical protein
MKFRGVAHSATAAKATQGLAVGTRWHATRRGDSLTQMNEFSVMRRHTLASYLGVRTATTRGLMDELVAVPFRVVSGIEVDDVSAVNLRSQPMSARKSDLFATIRGMV